MIHKLLLTLILFSGVSKAVTLVCQEEKNTNYQYIVLESTIEDTEKNSGVVVFSPTKAKAGLVGNLEGIFSSKYLEVKNSEQLWVNSGNAKDLKHSWRGIDPKKQCYRFVVTNTYNLKKVKNDWTGTVMSQGYMDIHPLEPNCKHPMPAPARPRNITCKLGKAHLND